MFHFSKHALSRRLAFACPFVRSSRIAYGIAPMSGSDSEDSQRWWRDAAVAEYIQRLDELSLSGPSSSSSDESDGLGFAVVVSGAAESTAFTDSEPSDNLRLPLAPSPPSPCISSKSSTGPTLDDEAQASEGFGMKQQASDWGESSDDAGPKGGPACSQSGESPFFSAPPSPLAGASGQLDSPASPLPSPQEDVDPEQFKRSVIMTTKFEYCTVGTCCAKSFYSRRGHAGALVAKQYFAIPGTSSMFRKVKFSFQNGPGNVQARIAIALLRNKFHASQSWQNRFN